MFAYAGEQMVANIRRRLFRSMLVQEVQFFDTCRTGELISRLSSDTVVLKDAVTSDIAMACVMFRKLTAPWRRSRVLCDAQISVDRHCPGKLDIPVCAVLEACSSGCRVDSRVQFQHKVRVFWGVFCWSFRAFAHVPRLYGKYVKKLSKEARKALANATCVAEEAVSNIKTGMSFVLLYACPRGTRSFVPLLKQLKALCKNRSSSQSSARKSRERCIWACTRLLQQACSTARWRVSPHWYSRQSSTLECIKWRTVA